MVYVQFGTENDRFLRKITTSRQKNSVEYSVTINTPQHKSYDCWTYCSECPLELSHDFLALALIELSKNNTAITDLSFEHCGITYNLKLLI